MHTLQSWRWIALAAALGLFVPRVRADMITPNSIPNPPSAVGSGDGTNIYSNSNLVTTQYTGLGLNFTPNMGDSTTAITTLNGVKVWAPAEGLAQPPIGVVGGPPVISPVAAINYSGAGATVNFVLPGTLTPTAATSLSVEIVGQQVGIGVSYVKNSGVAIPASIAITSGSHGGQLYTFPAGPGITSFSIFAPQIGSPPVGTVASTPAWGIAEISFTPAHAPEPASLLLGALGALSLAVPCAWRRAQNAVGCLPPMP